MLWKPAFFGVKPELIIKGGFIAGAMMGDGNASIPTPQPVIARIDVRRLRRGARRVQRALRQPGRHRRRRARRAVAAAASAVRGCRGIGKRDLVLNDALPKIEVDADTYEVRADGELLTCEPADVLPLAQRYFLF